MKSSSTHISRSLFKLGGSRGHQPGEHSGYGYPEIHLQKMGFRCSQEAPRQKPECHSIISDFNSSSSSNNNHTGKFGLLALLLLLLLPSTLVQPLAVVTHTHPRVLCRQEREAILGIQKWWSGRRTPTEEAGESGKGRARWCNFGVGPG